MPSEDMTETGQQGKPAALASPMTCTLSIGQIYTDVLAHCVQTAQKEDSGEDSLCYVQRYEVRRMDQLTHKADSRCRGSVQRYPYSSQSIVDGNYK